MVFFRIKKKSLNLNCLTFVKGRSALSTLETVDDIDTVMALITPYICHVSIG